MNPLDPSQFLRLVTHTLNDLAENCEAQLSLEDDVDLREDSLQITKASGQIWLLNRHAPSQELWLSSPINGGFHFRYDAERLQWIATRPSQEELYECLGSELKISLSFRPFSL